MTDGATTNFSKRLSVRAQRWIIAAGTISLVAGVAFSHVIEPGVRIEKLMLVGDIPAIRFSPKTQGPPPIALLAHGGTASKETLFLYGEALAVAGFDCYAVDLPGHGDSRRPFSVPETVRTPEKLERALGSVDVFLVPGIIIVALILLTGTWFSATPRLHRVPLRLALMALTWLALLGAGKLRMPRWSIAALAAVLTLGYLVGVVCLEAAFVFWFWAIVIGISSVLLIAGAILGRIVAHRGSRRDGDIAMAIFVGYAVGQWIPQFL
jgi:pimeloyl-ACP methyl ester carboxylesterase